MNNPLPSGTWQIDTAATTVTITVKKLLWLVTVPATLDITSGIIAIDADHQVTDVEITADARSYNSSTAKRDEYVLGNAILDAATHPAITLTASNVTARNVTASGSNYACTAAVTIKGKTTPIDLTISDVTISDVTISEPNGTFKATATVDRKAIGIDKMPTFVIGRDLVIDVAAKATRSG